MTLPSLIEKYPDLIGALVGLVTWFVHSRKSATKSADLWETLQDFALQAFPSLLEHPADAYKTAREVIAKHVSEGMSRLGIPRSKATDVLVNEVVEWAMARLAEKIWHTSFAKITAKLGEAEKLLDAAIEKGETPA